MNALLVTLGIEHWKPWLGALLMPPLPLLLLGLVGVAWLPRRRRLGASLVVLALLSLWLACTMAVGSTLLDRLTRPPELLGPAQRQALARQPHTVVLVLGAGRQVHALDYGEPDVSPLTLARLRYGAWLARQTGLPLAYSGGIGHGSASGPSEADIARRVAERDFATPLRWSEGRSRDTNENAVLSVALLREQGIRHIVLVTHGFHQQRALAAFQRAIGRSGGGLTVQPAPMGLQDSGEGLEFSDWLPTSEGLTMTRLALHEWLGWLGGA